MDKKALEEKETEFIEKIQAPPYPVDEMLALIAEVPSGKAQEWTSMLMQALMEAGDFAGMFSLVRAQSAVLESSLGAAGVVASLKKTAKDRLILSFVETAAAGSAPLAKTLERLEKLLSFTPGTIVLNRATWDWGAGEIRKLDYFYRRITVDFSRKPNHQMTFQAALDTLAPAPENHILSIARSDPDRVRAMLKDSPGVFLEEVLKAYGPQPVTRLEDFCVANGFVKSANWKAFWDDARRDMAKDKRVSIPARRADPIVLKDAVEDYGQAWFNALAANKDPKDILRSVREFKARKTKDIAGLAGDMREILGERLAFALKGAKLVDDALYAALAVEIAQSGFANPSAESMRGYLFEGRRYLAAAAEMPARDVGALVEFLLRGGEDAKRRILEAIPDMCSTLLAETIGYFSETVRGDGTKGPDAECEARISELLRMPKAPAPLVACVLGHREMFKGWKLPPLVIALTHGIALGEGRQNGETLRMQNIVRRLFSDKKWLYEILRELPPEDRVLFFERFEASIAWEPSSHHAIVVRMTQCPDAPELSNRTVRSKEAPGAAPQRVTSIRSYAERKAAYKRLVEVEMPKNAHDIEVARSYGDLRENFEYQAAKDEQRALLQKHDLLQKDLEEVKPVDFSGASGNVVEPGVTVVLRLPDGSARTWTILGEWDNDESRGIISCKARLAADMAGRKAGDFAEITDASGATVKATIESVSPLSPEMRAYATEIPDGASI